MDAAAGIVRVHGLDLLDGTPVLDIKPYIPYCDAFPDARAGWLDDASPETRRAAGSGAEDPDHLAYWPPPPHLLPGGVGEDVRAGAASRCEGPASSDPSALECEAPQNKLRLRVQVVIGDGSRCGLRTCVHMSAAGAHTRRFSVSVLGCGWGEEGLSNDVSSRAFLGKRFLDNPVARPH